MKPTLPAFKNNETYLTIDKSHEDNMNKEIKNNETYVSIDAFRKFGDAYLEDKRQQDNMNKEIRKEIEILKGIITEDTNINIPKGNRMIPKLLEQYIKTHYEETNNRSDNVQMVSMYKGFIEFVNNIDKNLLIKKSDFTVLMKYLFDKETIKFGGNMVFRGIKSSK